MSNIEFTEKMREDIKDELDRIKEEFSIEINSLRDKLTNHEIHIKDMWKVIIKLQGERR